MIINKLPTFLNPRHFTLDPRHFTLDPRHNTLDLRLSTKTYTQVLLLFTPGGLGLNHSLNQLT